MYTYYSTNIYIVCSRPSYLLSSPIARGVFSGSTQERERAEWARVSKREEILAGANNFPSLPRRDIYIYIYICLCAYIYISHLAGTQTCNNGRRKLYSIAFRPSLTNSLAVQIQSSTIADCLFYLRHYSLFLLRPGSFYHFFYSFFHTFSPSCAQVNSKK